MYFLIAIIAVFLGAILFYFYHLYRNRTTSKGDVLISVEPNKIGWFPLDAISSIFTGFITLLLIAVFIVSTLRGYRTSVLVWLVILSAILFFGVHTFDAFPTKKRRTLRFTDKGMIYWNMFYSWHEIEGYYWKPNSNGTAFSLKFFFTPWSFKTRIFGNYYSFDIDTKQKIDKILEGRVRIKQ